MFGHTAGEESRQLVTITSVSPSKLEATGVSQYGPSLKVNLGVFPSGNMILPSIGEKWLVEYTQGVFRLVAKHHFQDPRKLVESSSGDVLIGGVGVTSILGDKVQIESVGGLEFKGVSVTSPPLCQATFNLDSVTSSLKDMSFSSKSLDRSGFFKLSGTRIEVSKPGVYELRASTSSSCNYQFVTDGTSDPVVYKTTSYVSTLQPVSSYISLKCQHSGTALTGTGRLEAIYRGELS